MSLSQAHSAGADSPLARRLAYLYRIGVDPSELVTARKEAEDGKDDRKRRILDVYFDAPERPVDPRHVWSLRAALPFGHRLEPDTLYRLHLELPPRVSVIGLSSVHRLGEVIIEGLYRGDGTASLFGDAVDAAIFCTDGAEQWVPVDAGPVGPVQLHVALFSRFERVGGDVTETTAPMEATFCFALLPHPEAP